MPSTKDIAAHQPKTNYRDSDGILKTKSMSQIQKQSITEKKHTSGPRVLPPGLQIKRGETQKNVNSTILLELLRMHDQDSGLKVLDLPCGDKAFLTYLRALYPKADLSGADIRIPKLRENIRFLQMDLNEDFMLEPHEKFDLVTSVSGVMMFSNTFGFIRNCSRILKPGGQIVLTNDNTSTIIDRISYLLIGRFRIFRLVYEDNEEMTEIVPIQEMVRLLRQQDIEIEKIQYTSFYPKDLIYLPFFLMVYPLQVIYRKTIKTHLPDKLIKQMFPFKQFFCKHYIIYGKKKLNNTVQILG